MEENILGKYFCVDKHVKKSYIATKILVIFLVATFLSIYFKKASPTPPYTKEGGDFMFAKKAKRPYVLKLKKGEKPAQMSKERYEAAIAAAKERRLEK